MKLSLFFGVVLGAGVLSAQSLNCDLKEYQAADGLKADLRSGALEVSWRGERDHDLRAIFTLRDGSPLLRELAARKSGGRWIVLGRDLSPEFEVTSGRRRMSEQQLAPLRELKIALTPELIEREQWKAFWDAPLDIPGAPKTNVDMPRSRSEIRRAKASYRASGCSVKTAGARLEIAFPGLEMGIFGGQLRFTVYKGTNLLRQEAVAKTEEKSVAYKYDAGLKGFATGDAKVVWRDVARSWQEYEFGGSPNADRVALRARNRLALVETGGGSLAIFPPPHKFFFAREIELNLGYVWYRKDTEESFSAGVRQAEREEMYRPFGVSDEVWERRARQSRHNTANFALYNAPPGTWQRMPVYYYLSAEDSRATQQAVMAFTHDDRFKAMPGYQVAISHFHTHFNEMLADQGTIDYQPPWVPTFRALGINIAMMSDFHGDGHPADKDGPLRFKDQRYYFEGSRRHSDRSFLVLPGEEPHGSFGGHYTMMMSRPVYWTIGRKQGQSFIENDPTYGQVYHVGTAAEELDMLRREKGFVWQAHPRTKGSSGYPDAIRETEHFRSDRYLGGSYQSLPVDLSEKRLCESRCLGLFDEMNNWTGPKYMIAEGDTYQKFPDDETYPHLLVNYVKLDKLPKFDEDWSPILQSMRAGNFFVTSGEVLFRNWGIEGSGAKRTYTAEIEWTFPLDFVELVWGDGDRTGTEIVSTTGMAPHGSNKFRIPFDATGKKWVRFAAWDSAGNGALTQPVHLK